MIDISIIIVSFNTCELTKQCISSIYQNINNKNLKIEIIVVDNNSSDESTSEIKINFPNVELIELDKNIGFSAGNNIGIKESNGKYIFLLNSDTVITENSIEKMHKFLYTSESIASVGPILLNEDGSLQRSYFNFPKIYKIMLHSFGLSSLILSCINFFNNKKILGIDSSFYSQDLSTNFQPFETQYVLFAAVMFPRECIEKVGYLDEKMFFYHEDCEYGFRLFKANIKQWVLPEAKIYHLGGGSSSAVSEFAYKNYYKGLLYFYGKHYPYVSYIFLRIFLFIYFITKLFFSIFGLFKTLNIPSTYKRNKDVKTRSFDSSLKSTLFYAKLLFLSKEN